MSKLFNKYVQLKKQDSSKIYLFKSGIFYLFIDDDAIKMSTYLNLKLTKLNENIFKCGFPTNSLTKYLDIFKNFNLNISIIDNINEQPISFGYYIQNSNVTKLVEEIASINSDSLSISEIYALVDNLSLEAKKIIKEMSN